MSIRYKAGLPKLPEMAVNREGLGLQAILSRSRVVQFLLLLVEFNAKIPWNLGSWVVGPSLSVNHGARVGARKQRNPDPGP